MNRLLPILAAMMLASAPLSAQNIITSDTSLGEKVPSFRIALHGGGAYRFGKSSSNSNAVVKDHESHLRWGYNFGVDATWFFLESLGAGINFNNLHVGHDVRVTITDGSGVQRSGMLSDQISIWFLGPQVSYRLLSSTGRHALILSSGLGYMGYSDSAKIIDPLKLTGGTLGSMLHVGYDFAITKHIAIGASMYAYAGTLHEGYVKEPSQPKQKITLEKDNYESLTQLGLSVGLRFLL